MIYLRFATETKATPHRLFGSLIILQKRLCEITCGRNKMKSL